MFIIKTNRDLAKALNTLDIRFRPTHTNPYKTDYIISEENPIGKIQQVSQLLNQQWKPSEDNFQIEDKQSFSDWMNEVNHVFEKQYGLPAEHFPDYEWQCLYEDEFNPREAMTHYAEEEFPSMF